MDSQTTLTIITFLGLAVSFIAGLLSQLWKGSIEVEGQLRKQLTPAGWLSLGISLVSLMGSIASELIRISVNNNQRLQAQAEAAQAKTLQEQEVRWRDEMSKLLGAAKKDIEKNVEETVKGFSDSQRRFAEQQAHAARDRQDLLENALRNTRDIIIAGQPLASLSFSWQFRSKSADLWDAMVKGVTSIDRNSRDVQGGVPPVPLEIMDYIAQLLPILQYIARVGDSPKPADRGQLAAPEGRPSVDKQAGAKDRKSDAPEDDDWPETDDQVSRKPARGIAVLLSLDQNNAILSFGDLGGARWNAKGGAGKVSAGFVTAGPTQRRAADSTPQATVDLAQAREGEASSYTISWALDPLTLANSVDRRNPAIPSTARMPRLLNLTILYDIEELPFERYNFAVPQGALWYKVMGDVAVELTDLIDMTFTIVTNSLSEHSFRYRLSRMYRTRVLNDSDDEIRMRRVTLVFEQS
jgi:hypothetical protein